MQVKLNLGIDYQGKTYRDCSVRLLTMGGQCTAQEMIADLGIEENSEALSNTEKTLVDMAYLSQQITVEGIDKVDITAQFLFDNLATDDYWTLIEATLELRKKAVRKWGEPKREQKPGKSRFGVAEAFKQYRQAVILLSKFAMTAEQVWQMPLLEVFAWIESYLESEGVKTPHGPMGASNAEVKHESYVFTRRGKIE